MCSLKKKFHSLYYIANAEIENAKENLTEKARAPKADFYRFVQSY